jgi:hypothetical protein
MDNEKKTMIGVMSNHGQLRIQSSDLDESSSTGTI